MNARIVFDLDGTLIDSAKDIQAVANACLALRGIEPVSLEETHSFIGNGVSVFVQKMRAARGIAESEQDALLSDMMARYDAAVTLTETYPHVMPTLELLSQHHRLGICTNKPLAPCKAVLAHLGMLGHFGAVWGGDNPLARKPDPAPLLAALDELGADGPCLYVGDSEVDAETAQRAGVPFLLFTLGYRQTPVEDLPHAAHFNDFRQLPGIVGQVLAG